MEELQRVADIEGAGIRAEVVGAILANLSRKKNPRVFLVGHHDVGIALVVSQTHVERRPVLLDQVAFQHQRLEFGVDDNPLDVLDLADHARDADAMAGGFLKIASNSVLQRDGLANVKHLALEISVNVASRFARKQLKLVLHQFGELIFRHEGFYSVTEQGLKYSSKETSGSMLLGCNNGHSSQR